MYSYDVAEVADITSAEDEPQGSVRATDASNGTLQEPRAINNGEVFVKHVKSADTMLLKSGSDSHISYSNVLSNDDMVIVEAPKTVHSTIKDLNHCQDSASPNIQQQMGVYDHRGIQSNRAGPTIRSLSEAELPQPDTVRKAKDMFETLAKRQKDEIFIKNQYSFSQETIKPSNVKTNIGRSQSMLVLTGRAWCNGATLVSNSHHHNGACSDAVNARRSAFYLDVDTFNSSLTKFKTIPTYQRSCSELDKFFQRHNEVNNESNSSDLWDHFTENDRGSPVSPEVIRRIREHGTCVKFFGSEASVVGSTEDEYEDDGLYEGNGGYLLEYPYDLYHNMNSFSPRRSEDSSIHKPKIIGMVPKAISDVSSFSSRSSTRIDSEASSPSPSSHNGWYIGGGYINGVSLEDIQASMNGAGMDTSRSNSSLESGYVKLKRYYERPLSNYEIPKTASQCHGKWMKNPYWQGSYYVIYDFTLKDTETSQQYNGN